MENYRPISILPILYKLFSRMILERIKLVLAQAQSVDQAGFKSGFSCDDHLLTVVLLQEAAAEFRNGLWFAAVDFQKAFDSIEHFSIWESLANQKIVVDAK